MIDSDTRLRVARGIAKTETEASQIVFTTTICPAAANRVL